MGRRKATVVLAMYPVEKLRPAPWNPRKKMDAQAIEELKSSISQIGLKTPLLLRLKKSDDGGEYEIVSGHRRFYAVKQLGHETIKAIVESLTDDEAFIVNLGEQLQREDLTESEEAEAYRSFTERNGEGSDTVLAEKIGKSVRYVAKRIAIAALCKPLRWAWDKGIVTTGHMEQFLRVGEKKKQLLLLKDIVADFGHGEVTTVSELKGAIDRFSISFALAKFDPAVSGCAVCSRNSTVQVTMFQTENSACCSDQRCFAGKQSAWLLENWKTLNPETNTFRFNTEKIDYEIVGHGRETTDRCKSCPDFGSIITLAGAFYYNRVCLGKKECYAQQYPKKAILSVAAEKDADSDEPRVAWHGEYFRQQFYKERIPQAVNQARIEEDHEELLKLQLMTLLRCHSVLHPWLQRSLGLINGQGEPRFSYLSMTTIIELVDGLDEIQLAKALADATTELMFAERHLEDPDRQLIAQYLAIPVSEWTITEEYLAKKRKPEILKLLADLGFMQDQGFLRAMRLRNRTTLLALSELKKADLVEMILKSGCDLKGKVPAEVLALPEVKKHWMEERAAHDDDVEGTESLDDADPEHLREAV